MPQPENESWVGYLSMVLLFEGSKSEGMYPVLDTADGRLFRVHVNNNLGSDSQALVGLMNKRVCLYGVVDDLRGHWRLILDSESHGEILPVEDCSDLLPMPVAKVGRL